MLGVFFTLVLVELHTPHGVIHLNPQEVSSIREPYSVGHFSPNVKCVIVMTNGRFFSLAETCDDARRKLEGVR